MDLSPPETRKPLREPAQADTSADLLATRHAGLACLEPLTGRGESWLSTIAAAEASWAGDALIIELRYFPAIADAAIDAGLTFEHETSPN